MNESESMRAKLDAARAASRERAPDETPAADYGKVSGLGVTHTIHGPERTPLVILREQGSEDCYAFTVAGALKLADDIVRHARDAENETALYLLFAYHRGNMKSAETLATGMIRMRDAQRDIEERAGGSALDEYLAKQGESEGTPE